MNGAQEHFIATRRTARYVTLGPAAPDVAQNAVQDVWFVLHGYGQLAPFFIRHFRVLDDGSRVFVAPEALSRFYLESSDGRVGASWMTKEDRVHEINDYLAYLDALYDHVFSQIDRARVRVHVLGFSQGCATASRWAALGQARADRLTLWAGDLAHDLDLDAHAALFRPLDLTLVVGSRDQYLTPARLAEHEERLRRHALPYRLLPFNGGHHLDADVLHKLAALDA